MCSVAVLQCVRANATSLCSVKGGYTVGEYTVGDDPCLPFKEHTDAL